MGKKHIKRCSMSLVIREMQNKTAVRYHFTSTEEARLNFFLWLCSMPPLILAGTRHAMCSSWELSWPRIRGLLQALGFVALPS